jgi:hypothetical protein
MKRYRVRDWDVRLMTWADAMRNRKFIWGETDCHRLALDAVQVMYGDSSPLGFVTASWVTSTHALAHYRRGVRPAIVLKNAGAQQVPLTLVQMGDIIVLPMEEHFHPMLIALDNRRYLTSKPGEQVYLTDDPLPDTAEVWRLPNG